MFSFAFEMDISGGPDGSLWVVNTGFDSGGYIGLYRVEGQTVTLHTPTGRSGSRPLPASPGSCPNRDHTTKGEVGKRAIRAVCRLVLKVDRDMRVRLVRRLVGAIALGVGAIFGHKGEHEAHWSEPPNWVADTETDEADSGDP